MAAEQAGERYSFKRIADGEVWHANFTEPEIMQCLRIERTSRLSASGALTITVPEACAS